MMKRKLFFLGLLLPFYMLAQDAAPAQVSADPATTYAETISAHDLRAHLTFISHDLLEGRETGERGQHMAALYLATQFQKMGLAPGVGEEGYQQKFYLFRSEIKDIQMSFGKKPYEFRKDFFTFGAHGIPESLSGEFVYAGYGAAGNDALAGVEMKDKIVVIFAGSPADKKEAKGKRSNLRQQIRGWMDRAKELKKSGAKAVMMSLPDDIYSRIRPYARKRSLVTGGADNKGFPLFFLSEGMTADLFKTAKVKSDELKADLENGNAALPSLQFKKMKFSYSAEVESKDLEASNVLGYL